MVLCVFYVDGRFEIEGDEETQFNFTSGEHTHIHIPPSPPRDEYQEGQIIPLPIK